MLSRWQHLRKVKKEKKNYLWNKTKHKSTTNQNKFAKQKKNVVKDFITYYTCTHGDKNIQNIDNQCKHDPEARSEECEFSLITSGMAHCDWDRRNKLFPTK